MFSHNSDALTGSKKVKRTWNKANSREDTSPAALVCPQYKPIQVVMCPSASTICFTKEQ